MDGEPQRGQCTAGDGAVRVSGMGPVERGLTPSGGAMPASVSLRRPAGLIQSVVHGGENTVRTSTWVYPAAPRDARRSSRMTAMAGQPR